jgi:hypothetical protein
MLWELGRKKAEFKISANGNIQGSPTLQFFNGHAEKMSSDEPADLIAPPSSVPRSEQSNHRPLFVASPLGVIQDLIPSFTPQQKQCRLG